MPGAGAPHIFASASVITMGDNVYINGTANEFANCYAPSWGRAKARTRPATGNHDYGTTEISRKIQAKYRGGTLNHSKRKGVKFQRGPDGRIAGAEYH